MPSDEIHPLRSVAAAQGRWTRSVLTSALLAVAAMAPGASIAAEPDTSQEGGGSSGQVVDPDTDSPTFDPGGETDLPYDTGPGTPESSPDAAPLEGEPLDDPEGRAAPFVEPQTPAPSGPEEAPARPIEESPPSTPGPESPVEPPASSTPSPQLPATQVQQLGAERGSRAEARRLSWTVVASIAHPEDARAHGGPAVDRTDGPAGTTEAALALSHTAALRKAKPAGRVHVVRPGESLWIIAESLLADHASAIDIAAEVARLWELNRDRIPSGDPDLIEVGQQLKLR